MKSRAEYACTLCGEVGHYSPRCPANPKNGGVLRPGAPKLRVVGDDEEHGPPTPRSLPEHDQLQPHHLQTFAILSEQEAEARERMRELSDDLVREVLLAMWRVEARASTPSEGE